MTTDVISTLLEFKWRGIAVPTQWVSTSIEHDKAQHLLPSQDGGFIEPTGRRPLRISAMLVFYNGTLPGKGETWSAKGSREPLYPNIYRKFVNAFADRSSGELQHPELGILRACPDVANPRVEAERRDGVAFEASWIETNDNDGSPADLFQKAPPIAAALTAAQDLDREIARAPAVVQEAAAGESFESMLRKVQAVADTAGLVAYRAGGQVNAIMARVQRTLDAYERLGDVQQWPGRDAASRLMQAARFARGNVLLKTRQTATYVNRVEQSLVQIAKRLSNKVTDIVALNPDLVRAPFVAPGVPVKFYV